MSEKKGLKQSRLPFQIISTSPKAISEHKASPISSPKTPVMSSRKRKPSNEGDNIRSTKIGRTNSKENIIAEQDPIEIIDSDEESFDVVNTTNNDSILSNRTETTPTTTTSTTQERKLRIKIPSCSKRKQVIKPIQVDQDDSIVYLEEIQSTKKNKSSKKSEKKKSKEQKEDLKEKSKRVKKSLNLNNQDVQHDKKDSDIEIMETDDVLLNDNEKSDSDTCAVVKFEAIRDQLGKCMKEQLDSCKKVKIVLEKISTTGITEDTDLVVVENKKETDKIEEQSNENASEIINEEDKLNESKIDLDSSSKSSEQDQSSEKETSEPEESPKSDNNKEFMSEELSKLVDNDPENDSPNKDLHDEFVEIFTDDEKKSPTNLNNSVTQTTPKLTPKALARRKDQEAKRIEKEQQRQKEKEEKEKQRIKEKEMREEAKRKEREEKEEMRKREKEEREKKRLAEIEKKEEEKRQKEEERKRLLEQKEEEKRAKEEERRQKEEERKRQNEAREEERKKKELEKIREEERKKKAAQAFSKFFVPTKKKSDPQIAEDEASKESAESSDVARGNFMPFQIHGKMRLAPRVRNEISKEQKDFLDEILKSEEIENDTSKLYLKQLKCTDYFPKSSTKTWPEEDKDDDVIAIDELEGVGEDIKEDEVHSKMKHRAKLLLFNENRRPAFYGTWRKKSRSISARRPFGQDCKFFDYEVDSDEEWEEEEPGESLHGSDSEKEKDDDDYEVDDDFFVPHGHLSEDEMQHDDEVMEDNSPETQKAKLKVLQQEFAAEMKKKTEKIKPRLIGCIWMNGDEDENGGSMIGNIEKKYHCSDIIWRILKAREMYSSGEEIKMEEFEPEIIESEEESNNNTEEKVIVKQQKTPAQIKVRAKIEGDSVKELVKLLHGNMNSKKFLIKEFQAYRLKNYHKLDDFQEFSVKSVEEKINEISVYKTYPEEGPLFGKKCWCVKEDILKEYFGDEKLPLPNQWTYILEKEKKIKPNPNGPDSKKGSREVSPEQANDTPQTTETPKIIPESPKPSNSFKITNFVKSSPKTPSTTQTHAQSTSKTQIQITSVVGASPKVQPSTATNNANSGKKRVAILMSVQRGQSINEEKKNIIINQFLQTNQKKEVKPLNDNEIIEID